MSDEQPIEVYGVHAVEEALSLRADRAQGMWVDARRVDDKRLKQCMGNARRAGVSIYEVDRQTLDRKAKGGKHQGVVLEMAPFEYQSIEQWVGHIGPREDVCVLILDQIHDVGNLGAIARSAAAFGVDALVIGKDRSAQVTPAAIRASAGQLWRLPVIRVVNVARAIESLKEDGFWFWATGVVQGRQTSLWEAALTGRVGLVLGSEHEGVRKLVRKKCDHGLWIPMAEGVESLNVSVAAAVICSQVYQQRQKKSE